MNIKEKTFEEVLKMYEPAIKKQLIALKVYKDYDEFYQLGQIALWKAYEKFDSTKGSFSSYAIATIRGHMLSHLQKERTFQERHSLDDGSHFSLQPNEPFTHPAELECYFEILSPREKRWAHEAFVLHKKIGEIAKDNGVSINTAKAWRKSAIHKLRKNIVQFQDIE